MSEHIFYQKEDEMLLRISNLLAWTGFIASLYLGTALAVTLIGTFIDTAFDTKLTPLEVGITEESYHTISIDDYLSSPYLQSIEARVGDYIYRDKLYSSTPQIVILKEKIDRLLRPLVFKGAILYLPIWTIIACMINYIMIGRFRIIPWKSLR